jgi:hypothetical protein
MLKRITRGLASLGLVGTLLVGFPHPVSAWDRDDYHHQYRCHDRDHDCERGEYHYHHYNHEYRYYRYHRYHDGCYYDDCYYGYDGYCGYDGYWDYC